MFHDLQIFSQHIHEGGRDVGRHFTKALVEPKLAADKALVVELWAMRESMILGLGPGRPFAAESFVIVIPPALREGFIVVVQEYVDPTLDCRVPTRRASAAVAKRQLRTS